MPETPSLDRLTGQLYHLPSIIARMGLSVANAQKAFDANYVENIQKLLGMINHTLGDLPEGATPDDARLAAVERLLEALAPSRYQFTETTLEFSADLAETLDVGAQAGLGFGTPAITVNAALTIGYGYDYRAAARVTAKLHAIPTDPETAKALIARSQEIDETRLDLPERSQIDDKIWDGVGAVYNALTKKDVARVSSTENGG